MFKAVLSGADEARNAFKDFLHKKEEITKHVLTSKLKAIRLKYCQAVDTGRKTGRGIVVFERGSPAMKQIKRGLESSDLGNDATELLNTQVGNVYDDDLKHTESIGKSQEAISSPIQNKKLRRV